jgi:hypothetical protein
LVIARSPARRDDKAISAFPIANTARQSRNQNIFTTERAEIAEIIKPKTIQDFNKIRHSGESRNPVIKTLWTPAFAGVTVMATFNDSPILLNKISRH